jgi:hypothetical protein
MSRPGQEPECAPFPTGGNSEKAKQMNEVELRERYECGFGLFSINSKAFIFSLKI